MTPETAFRSPEERRREAVEAVVYGLVLLALSLLILFGNDERPASEETDRSTEAATSVVEDRHPNLPRTDR